MVEDMVRINMDRCVDSNILSVWLRDGHYLLRLLLKSKKAGPDEGSYLCSIGSHNLWIFERNHYFLVSLAFLLGNGHINRSS